MFSLDYSFENISALTGHKAEKNGQIKRIYRQIKAHSELPLQRKTSQHWQSQLDLKITRFNMTSTVKSLVCHAWTPPSLSLITQCSSLGLIAIRTCCVSWFLAAAWCLFAPSAVVCFLGVFLQAITGTHTHAKEHTPLSGSHKFSKPCKMQKKSDARLENRSNSTFRYLHVY